MNNWKGEKMLVKDLMSTSLICVSPDDDYNHICFVMRCEDIGIVPVCDGQNHLLGVITDRDMVIRKSSENSTAKSLMTESPVWVNSGDDIHQAALKFSKYGIRRLPVLESGRLVGMLTMKDLAKKKVLMAEIGHILYNICNCKD
jgi:CBS domain-containing protein